MGLFTLGDWTTSSMWIQNRSMVWYLFGFTFAKVVLYIRCQQWHSVRAGSFNLAQPICFTNPYDNVLWRLVLPTPRPQYTLQNPLTSAVEVPGISTRATPKASSQGGTLTYLPRQCSAPTVVLWTCCVPGCHVNSKRYIEHSKEHQWSLRQRHRSYERASVRMTCIHQLI